MKRAVALSLAATVLALALGAPTARAARERLQDLVWDFQLVPLDGQTPPPFTLEALDGRKVSLADFRGRSVLVYFWHSA